MELISSCHTFIFVVDQKIRMDLRKFFINLLKFFFIAIIIYISYQVLRVIVGGTWESENIIIAGMGIILAGMFVIVGFLINQGRLLGILEERTNSIGNSLSYLGRDFKDHLINYHK